MKKSPSLDGEGCPKLKLNSFSSLKLKTAHSVSLASFRFLKLDNTSCQMNRALYIVAYITLKCLSQTLRKTSGIRRWLICAQIWELFFTFALENI